MILVNGLPSTAGHAAARDALRVGLGVAYLGETHDVLDWGQPPVVGVLTHGHPGRVYELNQGQHVLVHWVGLEDADESQVVGFSTDDTGSFYPGLAEINDAEYDRRADALRTSRR